MMLIHWGITMGLWILVPISWLCSNHLVLGAVSPTVRVKNGTLEGSVMKSRRGIEFIAFRSIPYAHPPIGELRFKPPKPFDSWTGVRSAKEDSNVCTQSAMFENSGSLTGSEDCLYLNVYTPKLPSDTDMMRTNYPVMVWIHGGGWMQGGSHSLFYGPMFLLDHEIVLVSFNYRLGPLGFLSTEDLVSPGNQGLKDQAQALRWVQENIAAFGGDPNRVTIFGESAGAASVHYHMISPLSRGLFHRAISQSGTVNCPWAMSRPGIARKNANRLGKYLGCPTDDSTALVDCLMKKDAADFVTSNHIFEVFAMCPLIPFRPVIEPRHPGAFLTKEPAQLLKSGDMADVPWITGINSHEGSMKAVSIYETKDKGYDKLLDDTFMDLAPISLLYEHTCPDELKNDTSRKIRKFYLGDKKVDESTRTNVIDMYTDAWFYFPADMTVRDHLEALGSPVYYYYFTYKGSFSISQKFGPPDKDYGVSHGDEMMYLFPISDFLFAGKQLAEKDHKVIDLMTHLWVNFAKTGNPTPEITTQIPVKWKPVRTSKLEYLHIGGPNDVNMGADLLADRINFWADLPHRNNIELASINTRYARDEL